MKSELTNGNVKIEEAEIRIENVEGAEQEDKGNESARK